MNRSVTAEMHQIGTSPLHRIHVRGVRRNFLSRPINLETKPISSEVAYSNQSTRTFTTTPLQTHIVAIATSG